MYGRDMRAEEFISKWKNSTLNEKSGAHLHFAGLCRLLGVPEPTGTSLKDFGYGFEVNVEKAGGGRGYADVWKKQCFAWEYKSPGEKLDAALKQLKLYASDLENPPLLIVSDMRRIELHTNWTNMVQEKHVLELEQLADARLVQKLRWAFDPDTVEQLRPSRSANATTEEVAEKFVRIAQNLRERGYDPEKVAHFVNRMVFCMFAEDVDLLPRKMFQQMLEASLHQPKQFVRNAEQLFRAMALPDGMVGYHAIEWFNGGLFDDGTALPLTEDDIRVALDAAQQNWSEINPSIMGTLFERGLDPSKRSQIGAFYTDAEKIMMIVRPVIIEPLLREWADVRTKIEAKLEAAKGKARQTVTKAMNEAQALRAEFIERLKNFRILDPACGSGNFLYLALKALKDIEHRVNFEAQELGLPDQFPMVGPECVKGIEINPFAAELARVSVWIGEIQWMREKGFGVSKNPILKSLETIECRDALLNPDGTEAEWPEADVIIGNPPFLGGNLMLRTLGEVETKRIRSVYQDRVPAKADFVCHWFDKASRALRRNTSYVGLVATTSIKMGSSRRCSLQKLNSDGLVIFDAWSNIRWEIEGASVRVCLSCATCSLPEVLRLNGHRVDRIPDDLGGAHGEGEFDPEASAPLSENFELAFDGYYPVGKFYVDGDLARRWLNSPLNPNGRPNSDVLFPHWNGSDLVNRWNDRWIIDFGANRSVAEAALYQEPFSWVEKYVRPTREKNNRASRRER
jgi:hypothetical protein